MSKKYILHYGIHRGTIISRDSGRSEYDSYDEAVEAHLENKAFYKGLGYSIWFAEIIKPDGSKVSIDAGTPYW